MHAGPGPGPTTGRRSDPARLDEKPALHPNSANDIANILPNGGDFLHADFGGGGAYGIPYVTVAGDQPAVPINFFDWPEESDPGPVRTK